MVPMDVLPSRPASALNSQAPWDSFDSLAYYKHNYRTLREDDRQILAAVRDHFGAHFERRRGRALRGLDVGAGTNLYPALAMLPWCAEITLFERAAGNVAWLRNEVGGNEAGGGNGTGYGENWDEFWRVLAVHPSYRELDDPRGALRAAARVQQGDLFTDLPEQPFDIGTMFFVAESLSTAHEEFEGAVDKFARALRPGAPFAVAFMENSIGYEVGELVFPACKIVTNDVLESLLRHAADDLTVRRFEVPAAERLRDGYTGMLLALGRLKA